MVDVADGFHTGERDAEDVYSQFNRSIIGGKRRSGHIQPIKVVRFYCYNFSGHKTGQRVVMNHPGKCPECGAELEPGESGVSL